MMKFCLTIVLFLKYVFLLILDTNKSCLKCHPYVAGCFVVVIFLFTVYHANDIKHFVTSIFQTNSDPSDSPVDRKSKFIATADYQTDNNTTTIANSVIRLQELPILLLTLTTLPNILVNYV